MAVQKERLDVALVRRGLVASRERARALIMAGQVYVDERMVDKPGTQVTLDAACRLAEITPELKYVSRGGLKLEKALDTFQLDPKDRVAIDVGASTGGFTQCLLERGAKRVYAIDVGHGQLAWTLRNDPRVIVMEHTNIRHLTTLPEPMQCVVIDVSFISLRLVLPALVPLMTGGGGRDTSVPISDHTTSLNVEAGTDVSRPCSPVWIVALVKPQFEAGKAEVDRGSGVISDPAIHERVLRELQEWIPANTPLHVRGITDSPIHGRDGNKEFLFWLSLPA